MRDDMNGNIVLPFALGFVLGGLAVSIIDSKKRIPPPGLWIDQHELA
jgi:hypothetical protein